MRSEIARRAEAHMKSYIRFTQERSQISKSIGDLKTAKLTNWCRRFKNPRTMDREDMLSLRSAVGRQPSQDTTDRNDVCGSGGG